MAGSRGRTVDGEERGVDARSGTHDGGRASAVWEMIELPENLF